MRRMLLFCITYFEYEIFLVRRGEGKTISETLLGLQDHTDEILHNNESPDIGKE